MEAAKCPRTEQISVPIGDHFASRGPGLAVDYGESDMKRAKTEKQTIRQQPESLASLYRAIGPAAITAALICAKKKPSKKTAFVPRAA